MNILMLLTPKKDVKFLTINETISEALDFLRTVRFSSVPLLNNEGRFSGTITEGDILWHIEKHGLIKAKTHRLQDVARIRDFNPVGINAPMDELVETSLGQNFIPIVDDRDYFIGIVTRKDLISTFISNFQKKDDVIKTNTTLNALYKRRSIRKFKSDTINDEVLAEILKVTLVSPSARNTRAQHVLLIDNKVKISKLVELHQRGGQFANAPYLLLVLNDDKREANSVNANANSSALMMSLLLAIDSFDNLGGFWIATRSAPHNKEILKYLGVPRNFTLYGMIAFGIKNEFKGANEASGSERIHKNDW